MSTKKDKFSSKDKKYMRIALNLARARRGLTGENPPVGCVIVKNDKIISIGQTGYHGRPHAEHNAIKNSIQNVNGSKIYVTLEPCNHYGKTAPCTTIIIKKKIKEVFYSINDIDQRVSGKSYNILSSKKIKVKIGLLKNEAKDLYKPYFINRKKNIPFVTAKIATTRNNLIYIKGVKRITDETTDKFSHFLRYKNDAIMISSKTLIKDNPRLNCRLVGFEKYSPIRVILDKNLEIDKKSNIYKSAKKNNTIIFHHSQNNSKIRTLKKKKINLVKARLKKNGYFDLKLILKKLYDFGIRNLLIEGGDKISLNLIQNSLVDYFYVMKSSKILTKDNDSLVFNSFSLLNKRFKYKINLSSKLAKDKITLYKR